MKRKPVTHILSTRAEDAEAYFSTFAQSHSGSKGLEEVRPLPRKAEAKTVKGLHVSYPHPRDRLLDEISLLTQRVSELEAALTLQRRRDEELQNPRLRLLRVLRNGASARVIDCFYRHRVLSVRSLPLGVDDLEVLLELTRLGHASYENGEFSLTPAGVELLGRLEP
jgi:hypothetical protein